MPIRVNRRALALTMAGAAMLALGAIAPSASAAPRAHVLPSSKPGWTARARQLGTTASSTRIDFGILLGLRNSSEAEAALQAISTLGSASYGKWLTKGQFRQSYAPSTQSTAAVVSWLRSQGFGIRQTLASGMYVEAAGTAAQVSKTFGTTLKQFSYQGKDVRSNATALSLPASTPSAVVAAVAGVIGVDQGSALKTPADAEPGPPAGVRYGVQPCSSYFGQKTATGLPPVNGISEPYAVCGYQPDQLESAYGETPLLRAGVNGRGVTVAITDAYAAPTIASDLSTYSARHGLPQLRAGQFQQIVPSANGFDLVNECGASGWYSEETLDVEAVHTMAPGANIVYVGAPDCSSGLDEAWAQTIDNHTADIITNSWSDGTDDINLLGQDYVDYYTEFGLEAALTGITVNFSTGDSGDQTSGGTDLAAKTVGFPADVPYVTGVGGTSIEITRQGTRAAEYGWQNSYAALASGGSSWGTQTYSSGGGGGTSFLYMQPFYQRGIVPTSMSEYFSSTPHRTIPDISMAADPNTGFRVGETQTFPDGTYYDEYRIGGTSLSSPLLAGVVAVADQLTHRSLGFINPLYYELSRTPAIYDTVAPRTQRYEVRTDYRNLLDSSAGYLFRLQDIDVQTTTLKDVRGYDTSTGVGTPNGPAFFAGLALAGLTHR
jgi:subtilase family serine protease